MRTLLAIRSVSDGVAFTPLLTLRVRSNVCAVSAATDFTRGPESFTTPDRVRPWPETRVGSVRQGRTRSGEKNNDSGDAFASNFRRDGSSQRPVGGCPP